MTMTFEDRERIRRRLYRNLAYAIHYGMWLRDMSEDELVTKSGLPNAKVRSVLLAEDCGLTLSQTSELFFAVGLKPDVQLVADDGPPPPLDGGGAG